MQRTATLALAAFLMTASIADAQVRRTSSDLSNESVLPTTIVSAPLISVGSIIHLPSNVPPQDPANWLECNGQPVPPGTKYDRLRSIVGNNVPDYTSGQFLRSTTDASRVGTTVADSIKSHTVAVPGQSANVSASLDSTNVAGVASPQQFSYVATGEADAAVITSAPNSTVSMAGLNNTHWLETRVTAGGTVSANVNNGHVTGVAAVQPVTGVYSGASETAPIHSYVRTYIRAVQ